MNFRNKFFVLQMSKSLLLMVFMLGWASTVSAAGTTSQTDCLFNWAEKTYGQFFSPAGVSDATYAAYTYRYYSGTSNYLAVSSADNNVYVEGPSFGNSPVLVGPVTSFLGVSGCQQPQTIGTIAFSPTTLAAGGSTTVSATASSGLTVSFSSTTPTVCSAIGSTVTSYTTGTCTIAANQAGNASYSAAPQVAQPITVTPTGTDLSGTTANSLSRTPWQAMITPNPVVTISPPLSNPSPIHGDIRYYNFVPSLPAQDDSRWAPAPNGDSINFHAVSRVNPNLCFSQADFSFFQTLVTIPANTNVTTFKVSCSNADDGARLTIFNSTYPSGHVTDNSYVYLGGSQTADLSSYTAPGFNRLLITQVDDCYSGNNMGSCVVVLNGNTVLTNQTITQITFSPTVLTTTGTTTASATTTSGLAASFSSLTPSICTVSGNIVTAVSAGTCTIAADQTGNISYGPAPQVTQSIQVTPLTCSSTQVASNGACVTLTCTSPQVPTNGVCVTPAPTCVSPQVLQNGVCVTPASPTCVNNQVLQNGSCVCPAGTTWHSNSNYCY